MNQSVKLLTLACLLAASALAAGCVPSLNYGSVPPEPDYTTRLTTTTATSTTRKPFTTPKFRTGTISWEELNGSTQRRVYTERVKTVETQSYTAFRLIGDDDSSGESANNDWPSYSNADEYLNSAPPQTAAEEDPVPVQGPPPTAPPQTAPPQTAPPQTAPPQTDPPDVYVPPQEDYSPPPAEPAPVQEDFGE